MRLLLENIRQRWRERKERRAEKWRGTENLLGRLAVLLGTRGER